jgi:hypothetical protein
LASPDWSKLAHTYLYPYIQNSKNFLDLFNNNSKNQAHNMAFNMMKEYYDKHGYKTENAKKDLRQQGIVKNSDKMIPALQMKLLREGKVIRFQRNGKEIVRNNIKWTKEEIAQAKDLKGQGLRISAIAKRLGRSYSSVYIKIILK